MARKLWVVAIENFTLYYQDERFRRGHHPREASLDEALTLFTNQEEAQIYAQEVAQRNSGFDVQILESIQGFVAPPRPVEMKVWKDGNYVPA